MIESIRPLRYLIKLNILAWTNVKITNELQNRQRIDEIKFAKAGKGALVKTYKYDPTKPSPQMASKKS